MIQGTATKDAEFRVAGAKNTKITTFSLAVGKNKDTTTIFANCKAFHRLAEYAASVKKADSVLCIGTVEEREYNGKTYKDFICNWLNVANGESAVAIPPIVPAAPPTNNSKVSGENADIDDDGDLPF